MRLLGRKRAYSKERVESQMRSSQTFFFRSSRTGLWLVTGGGRGRKLWEGGGGGRGGGGERGTGRTGRGGAGEIGLSGKCVANERKVRVREG